MLGQDLLSIDREAEGRNRHEIDFSLIYQNVPSSTFQSKYVHCKVGTQGS